MSDAPKSPSAVIWIAAVGGGLAALVSLSTLLDQKYALKSDVVRLETKLDGTNQQIAALIRVLERQEEARASQTAARRRHPAVGSATIGQFPRVVAKLQGSSEWP
jgi:ferritin-like metal-binding protein YciE